MQSTLIYGPDWPLPQHDFLHYLQQSSWYFREKNIVYVRDKNIFYVRDKIFLLYVILLPVLFEFWLYFTFSAEAFNTFSL